MPTSYWFEKIGQGRKLTWTVFAYRGTERLYAVQDCFTRRQAIELCNRLNAGGAL